MAQRRGDPFPAERHEDDVEVWIGGLGFDDVTTCGRGPSALGRLLAGNASWCARTGDVGEETPIWYGRDGFFGIEWSCDIRTIQPTGMVNSWALTTDCLDAGYAYSETVIFVVTPQDRLLILNDTGVTANLVRCEEGKN